MKKRVPSFWWDFHWKKDKIFSIIVQSNEPQYPILSEFVIRGKDAMEEIENAEVKPFKEPKSDIEIVEEKPKENQNKELRAEDIFS